MTDLQETVARAIAEALPDVGCDLDTGQWYWPLLDAGTWPLADAAIAAARPIIRAELFDELIAEAEKNENPKPSVHIDWLATNAFWIRVGRWFRARKEADRA